jgi:hypothetical protein
VEKHGDHERRKKAYIVKVLLGEVDAREATLDASTADEDVDLSPNQSQSTIEYGADGVKVGKVCFEEMDCRPGCLACIGCCRVRSSGSNDKNDLTRSRLSQRECARGADACSQKRATSKRSRRRGGRRGDDSPPRVAPVISAFWPLRSKSLGAVTDGVGSIVI